MTWTWITVTSPTLRPEITVLEIPISKANKSLSNVINHSTTTTLVLNRLQAIRVLWLLSHLQLTTHRVCAITTHPSESELESATKKIVVGFSSKSLSILARNIPAPGKSITKILRKTNLMWYYKKHYHMRTLKSSLTHRHQLQTFLLDSGASISVLPCREIDKKHKSDTFRLTAANGSEINTYGERYLWIDFCFEEQLPWILTVADVKNLIIGVDFLHHHDISIQLRTRQLKHNPTNSSVLADYAPKPAYFPILSNLDTFPPVIDNLLRNFLI